MGTTASNGRHPSDQPSLKPASASLGPVAAPTSSCPFLLSFAKDASAQFSLCPYISFTDLAALNVTCRSWRAWMLFPPAVACGSNGGGRHWARFTSTSLTELSNCQWARGLLTELRANPERRSKEAQKSDATWDAQRNQQAMSILRTLPRFPNLESLRLIPTFGEEVEAAVIVDVIQTTFHALPRLARLKLSVEHCRFGLQSQHAGLPFFMQCVDQLRSLQELIIDGLTDSPTSNVSFERLQFCPALRRLDFTLAPYSVNTPDPPLLLSQISTLAQCTQIESLSCKSWFVPGPDPALALRRFVEVRLAAEELNLSTAAAANAARQGQTLLPVRTLIHLDLRTTELRIECMLPLLAHFPGLTDISPERWSTAGMDDFKPSLAHLSAFKQLRVLRLDARMTGAGQAGVDAILSHLAQSNTIQDLTLVLLTLTEAQLSALVRSLKALHTLAIDCVCLESLDALSDAPVLTSLNLHQCVLAAPPRVTLRGFVPRLPELSRLTILDPDHLRLTAAKAAPLNELLMQRCPKLVSAKFEQNLAWN